MNNTNDQNTATRYCHCYVQKPVNRTIHVCRKCGKQIYRQDVLSWAQVAGLMLLLLTLLCMLAYGQQNWGTTP